MNLCINILLFLRDEFLQRNADKKMKWKWLFSLRSCKRKTGLTACFSSQPLRIQVLASKNPYCWQGHNFLHSHQSTWFPSWRSSCTVIHKAVQTFESLNRMLQVLTSWKIIKRQVQVCYWKTQKKWMLKNCTKYQ